MLGLAVRLAKFNETVYADELSTLFIVQGQSLPDVIRSVSSDAEVTPPLFFVLAWAMSKLGSAPELIRVPSLFAGTISIPLVYFVGMRAVSRATGLIASAIVALSPFMIYFSTEGRSYAVTIALLLVSTLALLSAVRTDRRKWWIGYGLVSCLAMYANYTAVFPLVAQFAWLCWAFPKSRRSAIVANLGAVVLYLPWVSGLLADQSSPTVDLVEFLVGTGLLAKRLALESWVLGVPYQVPSEFPGKLILLLGAAGIGIASLVAISRVMSGKVAGHLHGFGKSNKGAVLMVCLGLSSPLLEAVIGLVGGPNLFGARNLGTASAGLALAIGTALSFAGPVWGVGCAVVVLSTFAFGTIKTLGADAGKPDFKSAAERIDSEAGPKDVIIDVFDTSSTPVPLTPLDVYAKLPHVTYRPLMPVGPPPFLPYYSDPPPASEVVHQALRAAGGHRVFVLGVEDYFVTTGGDLDAIFTGAAPDGSGSLVTPLPNNMRTLSMERFPGLRALELFVIKRDTNGPHNGE